MSLRTGITTGTCAAAAAKAAVGVLVGGAAPAAVDLVLPSGQPIRVPVLRVQSLGEAVTASVRKDAGDDPDVTDGLEVQAKVCWDAGADVSLVAGEGVGTVTKPGLQVPPGQPAINPVPRAMITAAVRQITPRGVHIEISIPGGRELAARTFNPRLGIQGGLSILGTTGIVRPYCISALRDALRCTLDVAEAAGVANLVLVPGNIGARAARRHFSLADEQLIEAGNEWGFLLDQLPARALAAVLVVGHPGKLVKLAAGQWDTHSARSASPVEMIRPICADILGRPAPESPTAEGLLAALDAPQRGRLSDELARRVRVAIAGRIHNRLPVAVFLVNMAGDCLGSDGDLSPWR